LNTNVSQGNVATYLNCGGIFNQYFIATLLLSALVKEFRKSDCLKTWSTVGSHEYQWLKAASDWCLFGVEQSVTDDAMTSGADDFMPAFDPEENIFE